MQANNLQQLMRCSIESDSDSYSSSNSEQDRHSPEHHQTPLQQLISLNVTIFNDLGFTVSADSFANAPQEYEEELPNNDTDSERSEIDYGDSEEEGGFEEEAEFVFDEEQQERQGDSALMYQRAHLWMQDESSAQESSQSPFFPFPEHRQEGLSPEDIRRIPTMNWGFTHNLFNRGEKCAVCLQDFQLGNSLRVMECLHRYHLECLDQWLAVRATCPSCRSPPKRIQHY